MKSLFHKRKKKLVYLHIEKSAGTSQRVLFNKLIGTENIFWHSKNKSIPNYTNKIEEFLIGGHKDFNYYRDFEKELVFSAVIRDPIERVLSLYNYDKTHNLELWLKYGFDPNSIKNTLINCERYVEKIKNAQCRYICGKNSYEEAIKRVSNSSFIIGDYNELDIFNSFLSHKLGLKFEKTPHINKGEDHYLSALNIDSEVIDIIKELTIEDEYLYQNVKKDMLINTVKSFSFHDLHKKLNELKSHIPSVTLLNLVKISDSEFHLTLLLENKTAEAQVISKNHTSISLDTYYLSKIRPTDTHIIKNTELTLPPFQDRVLKYIFLPNQRITKPCRFVVSLREKGKEACGYKSKSDDFLNISWS